MAHAEKCPICYGSGRIGVERTSRKDCHGCQGKGWIEVDDTIPVFPGPYPTPVPMPYLPRSGWHRDDWPEYII